MPPGGGQRYRPRERRCESRANERDIAAVIGDRRIRRAMRPGGVLIAAAGCVTLAAAALWHGWSPDTARPAAIRVVAGNNAARKAAPPLPKSAPPVVPDTPLPNAPTAERAASVVTDFAAHASAPLAVKSSTCSGSRCRVAVYQTADYVQRGRKFYESEDFTALARAAGAQAVRVTPYYRPDRSGYLIDMMF